MRDGRIRVDGVTYMVRQVDPGDALVDGRQFCFVAATHCMELVAGEERERERFYLALTGDRPLLVDTASYFDGEVSTMEFLAWGHLDATGGKWRGRRSPWETWKVFRGALESFACRWALPAEKETA